MLPSFIGPVACAHVSPARHSSTGATPAPLHRVGKEARPSSGEERFSLGDVQERLSLVARRAVSVAELFYCKQKPETSTSGPPMAPALPEELAKVSPPMQPTPPSWDPRSQLWVWMGPASPRSLAYRESPRGTRRCSRRRRATGSLRNRRRVFGVTRALGAPNLTRCSPC